MIIEIGIVSALIYAGFRAGQKRSEGDSWEKIGGDALNAAAKAASKASRTVAGLFSRQDK